MVSKVLFQKAIFYEINGPDNRLNDYLASSGTLFNFNIHQYRKKAFIGLFSNYSCPENASRFS